MKLLHSADWHLDSPMLGHSPAQQAYLRGQLRRVPGLVADVCRREDCDLVLLAGDLFDGAYTPESYQAVYAALEQMAVPVLIAPGNHDHMGPDSPWERELWPENVHIFTGTQLESQGFPALDCRVYGAGFQEKDCPPLLTQFRAEQKERYAVAVLHGDPTLARSDYNPISTAQVRASGLTYLALGHIHQAGAFREGETLCAWPGCPMGTGFDELGPKGVYIAQLEEGAACRFVQLDTPRFYDLELPAGDNALESLNGALPAVGNADFYRITLTGHSEQLDISDLSEQLARFPNLTLRDATKPPLDLWEGAGSDSFEGMYFGRLQEQLAQADDQERETILLAAKLSRMILLGEEVDLP